LTGLAAAALVAAVVVVTGRSRALSRGVAASHARGRSRRIPGAAVGGGVCVAVVVVVVAVHGGWAVIDLAGLAVMGGLVAWLVRNRRRLAAERRRHDEVVALCGALAAELHAGLPAQSALRRACAEWHELAPIERAARLGGDIPSAFRSLADRPGAEGLRAVAAGWAVASHSGASLAAVLERVGDGLRDQRAARAEVESALEPPRATARMLAVLPVFGVLLGTAMGAEPLSFLFDTSAGRLCLLVGATLALGGVAWVERLAAGATRGW
jgi:tight adherence protein B